MVRLPCHMYVYISITEISEAQTFASSDAKSQDSNTVLCVQVFFASVSSRCFSISDVLISFLPSRCKICGSYLSRQLKMC